MFVVRVLCSLGADAEDGALQGVAGVEGRGDNGDFGTGDRLGCGTKYTPLRLRDIFPLGGGRLGRNGFGILFSRQGPISERPVRRPGPTIVSAILSLKMPQVEVAAEPGQRREDGHGAEPPAVAASEGLLGVFVSAKLGFAGEGVSLVADVLQLLDQRVALGGDLGGCVLGIAEKTF